MRKILLAFAMTAVSGSAMAGRCPDTTYVSGTECRLAPDGKYVGGKPVPAPDGRYVAESPRLAPNGKYVGGNGPLKLCPDNSYVRGARCRLMPDGTYVGES